MKAEAAQREICSEQGKTKLMVANPYINNMKGRYKKNTSAKNINYLVAEKSAVIKFDKHKANDIIRPQDNQTSDAYMQKYRKYGICEVYDNKKAGIRCSHANS